MVVLDGAGGRGEGEEVIDRRGDFEGALVAMAHHAGEPFRVDDPGADDAADLLLKRAYARRLRARMVVVVNDRRGPGEMAYRRGEAALELVVVVAVEQVVLAVVLVLHHRLGGGEPVAEQTGL